MFSAWGRFVYRFRRPIAVLSIVFAVAASVLASGVTGALSAGGWTDPDSESAAVTQRLAADFDAAGSTIVAVYRGRPGDDARSPEFQTAIADSLHRLLDDDRVEGAIVWAETKDDRFISTDGTSGRESARAATSERNSPTDRGPSASQANTSCWP